MCTDHLIDAHLPSLFRRSPSRIASASALASFLLASWFFCSSGVSSPCARRSISLSFRSPSALRRLYSASACAGGIAFSILPSRSSWCSSRTCFSPHALTLALRLASAAAFLCAAAFRPLVVLLPACVFRRESVEQQFQRRWLGFVYRQSLQATMVRGTTTPCGLWTRSQRSPGRALLGWLR
jgi:hypothetical protein